MTTQARMTGFPLGLGGYRALDRGSMAVAFPEKRELRYRSPSPATGAARLDRCAS